ncbi:MAG: DUF3299 domain-containing protein, partial [Pseudomonadota bacterium]
MKNLGIIAATSALLAAIFATSLAANPAQDDAPAASTGSEDTGARAATRTLYWEDLMPEGEWERLEALQDVAGGLGFGHEGGEDGPSASQIGTFNVVDTLDGTIVRLPGFVLPFEYAASGELSEFLLVPYFGACVHVPPPPPNQMVYVNAANPVRIGKIWDAVW